MKQQQLSIKDRHDSIRGWFIYELYHWMQKDEDIWVVTGDLGYKMFDFIRRDFPKRFFNAGSSEQAMTGIAVGLALQSKKIFLYSITPFLLYRPFETIRNYIHEESIPVRLIGSGRDTDYFHDGFSHWAKEDRDVMKIFHNITSVWPDQKEDVPAIVEQMVTINKPWYCNLRK